jgi:peptidoglycan/xylan/chitin deacetylase (PgdA/CDA1 family)
LTYDDGPEPGGTDLVLEALAQHKATATFFVLLTRAHRYGSLLAEVVAEGHEIALHGVDHRRLTDLPYAEVKRRTTNGKAELEDLTGRRVDWMRPPYGRQTLSTWRAVRGAGLMPVMWGPTMWDSLDIAQQDRVSKAQEGAVAGAILLGHDGFAGPQDGVDDGPAPVLDRGALVDQVLERYRLRGLTGCALGDALTLGTAVREARFRR